MNLVIKQYFLSEIERDRIEDEVLKAALEDEHDITVLDDREIMDLFNNRVKEQSLV